MINSAKSNWHLMLYSVLWAYQTYVNNATGFLPFQFVYRMEAILHIEYQVPSLNLAVEILNNTTSLEECLLYLEKRHDVALDNEAHKK
jgi:hypothetical protein